MKQLQSSIDNSINWIEKTDPGFWETRYVDKGAYQVIYLSAQSGCNHGCRFCHLTATRQTEHINASQVELLRQAKLGIENCNKNSKLIHYNFMARGEPLANNNINDTSLLALAQMTVDYDFLPRFLISTIIPRTFKGEFSDKFKIVFPDIYYSLYSVDESFRKHWMPNAMAPELGLSLLKRWQQFSKKIPKIHFSLIPGENDTEESIAALSRVVHISGLRVDFNLVMYNEPETLSSDKPPRDIFEVRDQLDEEFPNSEVKVINRIGPDVYASCGMFFNDNEE